MSRIRRLPAVLTLVCVAGCAGYRMGTQSLYPADVTTVYVPIFESESFRPDLGERLTEAVIKQVELTTPYKVIGNSSADSVLSGRIVSDTKRVIIENDNDQARESELQLAVEVRWISRRGDLIRGPRSLTLSPAEAAAVARSAPLIPEAGQSVATAQQVAIDSIARQIVSMMEVPW